MANARDSLWPTVKQRPSRPEIFGLRASRSIVFTDAMLHYREWDAV